MMRTTAKRIRKRSLIPQERLDVCFVGGAYIVWKSRTTTFISRVFLASFVLYPHPQMGGEENKNVPEVRQTTLERRSQIWSERTLEAEGWL